MADKTNGSLASKKAGDISKMDAIRQALAKLGQDAKPLKIQDFVKQQFGIEMTTDRISNCKSEILKEKQKTKPATMKSPAAATKSPAAPKPLAVTKEESRKLQTNDISLGDIETVKDLVERVGADSLRKLIGVLAR
jgi:hypothetical protein